MEDKIIDNPHIDSIKSPHAKSSFKLFIISFTLIFVSVGGMMLIKSDWLASFLILPSLFAVFLGSFGFAKAIRSIVKKEPSSIHLVIGLIGNFIFAALLLSFLAFNIFDLIRFL
ncbi:MAG: hypothetical protein AAFO07_30665 [Bacteroidota bacterium]